MTLQVVIQGTTQNATVVQALLENLVGRAPDPAIYRLFIIDGAKALSKATRSTLGCHHARAHPEGLPTVIPAANCNQAA